MVNSDSPARGSDPATVREELTRAVDHAELVLDPDVIGSYAADRAMTAVPGRPCAVVRAATAITVQRVMQIAANHRVPVVPRGLGTGLSGGSTAIDGCIVLSTEVMRSIEVDAPAMLAVVGPGLRNSEVKAAAAGVGLWYPPDPSSFEICSIGGNLATNAGGLCCVRYGVTTDYVLGLQVVLADGRMIRLGGRTIKDVAGYDLKRLFIGSEGTLGVITEATLRLRPPPPPTDTIVATFDSLVGAGSAVSYLASGMRPSALELMDSAAIEAVERVTSMGLDRRAAALLLVQVDSETSQGEQVVRCFEETGATYVARSTDPDEGEMLMAARRMAIPCVERTGTVLIEDVGVPLPAIPELLTRIQQISVEQDTSIPVIGHAGDGNFHPLVTFDATDGDATARAATAFDEVMQAAIELGGTITGEHGVGTLKATHLTNQLGNEVMDLTRSVKAALDPLGILNPGKWV